MGNTTLDKQNLVDLATGLNAISAFSDQFFDLVRSTISDISEKIQTDNCGTRSWKDNEFADSLQGLVSSSSLPDISATLSQAITEVAKKL